MAKFFVLSQTEDGKKNQKLKYNITKKEITRNYYIEIFYAILSKGSNCILLPLSNWLFQLLI